MIKKVKNKHINTIFNGWVIIKCVFSCFSTRTTRVETQTSSKHLLNKCFWQFSLSFVSRKVKEFHLSVRRLLKNCLLWMRLQHINGWNSDEHIIFCSLFQTFFFFFDSACVLRRIFMDYFWRTLELERFLISTRGFEKRRTLKRIVMCWVL